VVPLLPAGAVLLTAARADLEALAGFPFHRGLLAAAVVPPQPDQDRLRGCRRLLALPAVADAENLGQLLRTAAALGLDGVLLGPGPDPFSRRTIRVSMGTAWKLPIWRREDVWGALEDWRAAAGERGEIAGAALAARSVPVQAWNPPPRTALVLGPEGPGLGADALARCDRIVRIPMADGVDSLNVAAAGAILMHRLVSGTGDGSRP
jgi:tRNA G18 (ribose-2'-O)-methylase SpoU